MKLIKTIKAGALFILFLISFSSFAAGDVSKRIDNDGKVCGAVRRGNVDDLEAGLRERFDLSLEEAYLNIWCGDTDLMGTVLESPHERYGLVINMGRYFAEIGKPELLNKLLLTKVNGRNVLRRIEFIIRDIEEVPELRGGDMHTRLLLMKKNYPAWMKDNPFI